MRRRRRIEGSGRNFALLGVRVGLKELEGCIDGLGIS